MKQSRKVIKYWGKTVECGSTELKADSGPLCTWVPVLLVSSCAYCSGTFRRWHFWRRFHC